MSVCLSIYVSIYLSIYLSTNPGSLCFTWSCSTWRPSRSSSSGSPTTPSWIYPSIYLSIYLSIYISIHLSIYLSIYLSTHPGSLCFTWSCSTCQPLRPSSRGSPTTPSWIYQYIYWSIYNMYIHLSVQDGAHRVPTGPPFLLHIYLLFSHVSFINTFKHVKDALYVISWFLYCLGFLSIEQILFVIFPIIYLSTQAACVLPDRVLHDDLCALHRAVHLLLLHGRAHRPQKSHGTRENIHFYSKSSGLQTLSFNFHTFYTLFYYWKRIKIHEN